MGVRVSTLKQPGKGTNRSNAYRGRIIGGPDGAKVWEDLWLCNHLHDNRDNDANHAVSARTCAEWALHRIIQAHSGVPGVVTPDVVRRWGVTGGLFLLEDARPEQLEWLAQRAQDIRTGKVGNAGNRRAYPEEWVTLADGRKYRGKLWEKNEDSGLIRRLFVAGPFGEDEYLDGYVDLTTHEVHIRGKTRDLVPLGWQDAAKKLEWAIPQWAPRSESAKEEFHGQVLSRAKTEEDGSLEVPAAYRLRINREGGRRTYDIVEVQTEKVVETGFDRVPGYRRVRELNEEQHKVNRKLKLPPQQWADKFLREAELWGKGLQCSHCGTPLAQESAVWLTDHVEGGGLTYCTRDCGRKSLNQLDRETVEKSYIDQENMT